MRYNFKVDKTFILLISLFVFSNVFHNTGAEYLIDLLPYVLVLIWGTYIPSFLTFLVVWECISLFSWNNVWRSFGNFLFLKSNMSFNCSIFMMSSSFKSWFLINSSLVWLLNGAKFIIRMHFFCSTVMMSILILVVNDHMEHP